MAWIVFFRTGDGEKVKDGIGLIDTLLILFHFFCLFRKLGFSRKLLNVHSDCDELSGHYIA